VDIEFVDTSGDVQTMRNGFTRLRTFFLRRGPPLRRRRSRRGGWG
jgi:hypothetical protein